MAFRFRMEASHVPDALLLYMDTPCLQGNVYDCGAEPALGCSEYSLVLGAFCSAVRINER
jgi:hypothetical protein